MPGPVTSRRQVLLPRRANQCHFVDQKVAVTMDDFGGWMGDISHVSKAFTTKAAIVAALKADGDSTAAGLESMTDAKLAGVRWRCPVAQTARA